MNVSKNRLRIEQCQTFILVANQFDESFVIDTLDQRQGVGIVAVQDIPIQGCHGLTILPDFAISELLAYCNLNITTLIIPGNDCSLQTLFSDPRVYDLIERRLHHHPKHAIVTIPAAYTLMLKAGLTNVTPQTVRTIEGIIG